jgi:hypothetical protein
LALAGVPPRSGRKWKPQDMRLRLSSLVVEGKTAGSISVQLVVWRI